MQRAYLIAEDPTAPNFWRKVAQHVPGKTAEECLNRIWAAHPTPTVPKKGREADADSDDEPLPPPPRAHAAGELVCFLCKYKSAHACQHEIQLQLASAVPHATE